MHKKRTFFIVALLLALVLGVSAVSSAPPAQEEMTYTVKLGDNLWTLAEKYLGSGPAYWAIVGASNAKYEDDASFAFIANPNLIHPGWKLLIPSAEDADAYIALAKPTPATLLWAFWGSPAEAETHGAVADVFMAEYPHSTIDTMVEPWGDYFTKVQTLWASGDPSVIPDVLFLWPTPRYAADGVLENLQPWIEKSGYDLDDYWPALLESAMYQEDVYGFPRDIGLEVLYYSKDIFDEVGVGYPTDAWTWDDLLAAAEQLTVVEASGRVARYALGMEGGKYLLWVNQNKGSILDDMRNPSKCTLTEPAAVEAIEFFAGVKGAKRAHGSKRSAWGAIIGGIAGAIILSIFGPVGSIIGSFLGTFLGAIVMELTSAETTAQALKVGYWAMIGRIVGFCIKTAISIGIIFGVIGTGIVKMFL